MRMPAPMHDPRDVGTLIVQRLGSRMVDSGVLGRMVWLCDGWTLAITGQRLCDARAIAFDTGPGYQEIMDEGHLRGVRSLLGVRHGTPARLADDQNEIVDRVLAKYGRMTSSEAGRCVRSPSGAWMRALLSREGRNAEITSAAMLEEFSTLARLGREASARAAA